MKMLFAKRLARVALLTFASSSAVSAEAAEARIGLQLDRISAPLTPITSDAPFDCVAPAVPAKIELNHELTTNGHYLSAFQKSESSVKKIVVRRGGQVQQEQDTSEAPARFSKQFYNEEQQSELAHMKIKATLFFCDYAGFPEFIKGDFFISGQIGSFTAKIQRSFTTDERQAISLLYQSRNWTAADGWQFEPLNGFGYRNQPDNIMGELSLYVKLPDAPFDLKVGNGQILVHLDLTSTISVIGTGVAR